MGFYLYDAETKDFNEILSAKELSKKVYDTLNFYQERCEMLIKANQELMEEARARADAQLKQENERLRERLNLCVVELNSTKELEAYKAFIDEHKRCRSFSKYFQDLTPYIIQHRSQFGTINKAKCPICNEEKDITDMEAE